MLVYLLSTFLGFGADLLRVEVPTGFRWINRIVSSQCITYFHRSMFEQVRSLSNLIPPRWPDNPDIFSDSLVFPEYPEKYLETSDLD
jgi:hypothetical protein